ncbi:MAG TPA: methyltransferase domain-containing protein [Candidatus Nitrosotalea sp.]|nr:methyltransferase domain-containing protein [Candidatus Nitrosotalea sp.]
MPEDPRTRFGPVAANYAVATYHTDPAHLDEIVNLARPQPDELVLDVATGTGNAAFASAPFARRVVGVDLTPQMLAQAHRLARERGLANVSWVNADAHRLPFADACFDVYTARAAPHHFADLQGALLEAARVIRPGGRVCLVDCSPPPEVAEVLHEIEIRRDPSHVRSRSLDEWTALLERAGLEVESAERRELFWAFDDWMDNMAVPQATRLALESLVEKSPAPALAALRPERREGRLHHAYWHALIRARRQ